MANGFGVPRRTSPLRGIVVQPPPDPTVPLLQGLTTGLGIIQRQQEREEDQQREERRHAQTLALGRMSAAVKLLENKNLPSSMKVRIWNETVAPAFNALQTAPGSTVEVGAGVPQLTEWPDTLTDVMKKARAILDDKNLGVDAKIGGLRALQVEAGDNVDLAPLLEQLKDQRTRQHQQDVAEAERLLAQHAALTQSGEPFPDAFVTEWTRLANRNPAALADAQKQIDERGRLPIVGAAPRLAMGPGAQPAAVPAPPEAGAPAAPETDLDQRIAALDAEIQRLLGPQGQTLGRQARNQRIDNLQQELTRLQRQREGQTPTRQAAARFAELVASGLSEEEAASQALREHGDLPASLRAFVPELQEAETERRAATGVGVVEAKRKAELRQPLPGDLKDFTGADTLGKAQAAGFVFDPTSKDVRDFRRQISAAKDAFRQMDRVQDIVIDTPEALGLVGAAAATAEGAIAQATNLLSALARNLDFRFTEGESTLRQLTPIFSEVGITNRRLQSQLQDLVIAVAETEGFTGRALTDRKLQLMADIVTGATQSPAAFVAVVDDLRRRVHEKLQLDSTAILGAPGRPLLTPDELAGRSGQIQRPEPAPTDDITIIRRRPAR